MADINKTIAGLKGMARKAAEDKSPSYCGCGTCAQAIYQADEILKTAPDTDCTLWAMQVATVMFTRAADIAQSRGMNGEDIQTIFASMAMLSHTYGMTFREAKAHFEPNKKIQPKPGKPV